MTVSQARLNAYRSQVDAYSEAAGTFVSEYISALLAQNPSMSVAEVRNEAIEAIKDSLNAFGDQAASVALDFLEDIVASYGLNVSTSIVDAIDDAMIDGGVRYAARKLIEGDIAGFTGDVADLSRFYTKRIAFENMVANCESNNIRYARVPSGFETCEFCIMLASRGFVYHTAQTAGEGHAYHKSCDCVVVPGVEGIPAFEQIESYDPDAYYSIWQKVEKMKADGVSVAQRKAVLATMHSKLISTSAISSIELAELYQAGMKSAWSDFKSIGKTREAYQATVEAYLKNIGDAAGGSFSAEFMAQPTGEEIWAAVQLSGTYGSVKFRYATSKHKNPDFLVDGTLLELKTPQSERKITKRLLEISNQFAAYQGELKVGAISLLNLDVDADDVVAIVKRFVVDGTLDVVYVISKSGDVTKIER